ncbi:hypothetical protein GQ457_01G015330 [Hibiscus cannabinus]
MRKGVLSDEMLRGVKNKSRSEDSRIGQPFELLLNPWADKRQPGEMTHDQKAISDERLIPHRYAYHFCLLHSLSMMLFYFVCKSMVIS